MPAYRYVIFTDDVCLSMVEAWPGIRNGHAGQVWTLNYAKRSERDAIWGPPEHGVFEGDLAKLRRTMIAGGWTNEEQVA